MGEDTQSSIRGLSDFIAEELEISASDLTFEDKLVRIVPTVHGEKFIAQLASGTGMDEVPEQDPGSLKSLLYGPLAEVISFRSDLKIWIPIIKTTQEGGIAGPANYFGKILSEILSDPKIDTNNIQEIVLSGARGTSPDHLEEFVQALRSYQIHLSQNDANNGSPNVTSPPLAQTADFRSDRPVTDMADDALDRTIVARAIYEKVKAFWTEGDGPPPRYPFMVHIAGRWGSGKSTILNFLGQILKEDESLTPPRSGLIREDRKTWVVVNFNAWQHQAQRPVWWSLLNAVADQAALQMEPRQSNWFTNRNRYFRFRIDKGWELTLGFLAVTLVLGLLWITSLPPDTGDKITETVETTITTDDPIDPDGAPSTASKRIEKQLEVTREPPPPAKGNDIEGLILKLAAIIGAVTTIWTAFQKFFQRTQETANALVALDDTTAPLKQRFEEMIAEIHRPVAIFIDDLDRCDADYVIELLQAIQTIYVDVPVLYVVAADRDWIVSAYDQSYKGFKTDIDRPGQPLGYLFVKKIFQLSVNVPDLDSDYGKSFLEAQLQATDEDPIDQAEAARIRAEVQAAPSLQAAQQIIEAQPSLKAKRIAGGESFLKSLAPEAQEEVEHLLVNKLTEGEMLLDPNPRAIKRLVNAYSFRSGFALSAGQTQVIEKLPYWCVLDLRFPYSAERLAARPDLVDFSAWEVDGMTQKDDGTYTGTNRHFPVEDHEEIAKILAHLTADDIRDLRLYG